MSLTASSSQRVLFRPARSTRHRIACLALYRALVRKALLVPLDDEARAACDNGFTRRNPIHELVRRQFRRNGDDISKRLVFAALTSGYKFLDLLGKAQDATSSENQSMMRVLAERRLEAERSRKHDLRPDRRHGPQFQSSTLSPSTTASDSTEAEPAQSESANAEPATQPDELIPEAPELNLDSVDLDELISKVSEPSLDSPEASKPSLDSADPILDLSSLDLRAPKNPIVRRVNSGTPFRAPVYTRAKPMRPTAELKSRRHIPVLVVTAAGIPWLRFGKPQPQWIDIMIRARLSRRERFADLLLSLDEEVCEAAEHEDEWEAVVGWLQKQYGAADQVGRVVDNEPSYVDAVKYSHELLTMAWSADTLDLGAQALAMYEMIDEERTMRDKEDAQGWFYPPKNGKDAVEDASSLEGASESAPATEAPDDPDHGPKGE